MTSSLGVKERSQNPWLLGLGLALGALLLLAPGLEAGILDVAWNAPTTSEDGSPLTDLSSYLVYFGPSSSPCSGSSFELVAAATPIPSPGEVITHRLTGLTTGMSYSVQVTAVDISGNESACSNEIVALAQPTPDTTPPQVPSGLTATAVSSSEIDLVWNAATDDVAVTGYRVYRDGGQIALATSTSYRDAGLAQSTTYSYTVAAYDAAGNLSQQSAAGSATTQAPVQPTPPQTPPQPTPPDAPQQPTPPQPTPPTAGPQPSPPQAPAPPTPPTGPTGLQMPFASISTNNSTYSAGDRMMVTLSTVPRSSTGRWFLLVALVTPVNGGANPFFVYRFDPTPELLPFKTAISRLPSFGRIAAQPLQQVAGRSAVILDVNLPNLPPGSYQWLAAFFSEDLRTQSNVGVAQFQFK